jgi:hypothetical protein
VFYVGGLVAPTAGLHMVIAGAKSLPRQGLANPSVESELRFYAASDGLQLALLVIELAAPPPIVTWQARLAARG